MLGMETWKIVALSLVGLIWLASVVFVAWLYPEDPKSDAR
jgi:hypothetical protein